MKDRRHISPEQKLIILRELFQGNSTVSLLKIICLTELPKIRT